MSLFSLTFIAFLFVVSTLYFIIPKRFQWMCLLLASYVFYAWADIKITGFLIFSTICTFLIGLWVQKLNDSYVAKLEELKQGSNDKDAKKELKHKFTNKKRIALAVGIVANFLVLAVVKYADFVIGNINSLTGSSIGFLHIALPLGISFYTFQTAGYLIDIYRGKIKADTNIFKYALFVSYFPQIIQGPIGRHHELSQQFFQHHDFDYDRVKNGLIRVMWGFFKKMVIADRIALIVNQVFDNYKAEGYQGILVFFAVFLYSIQIYADFSGGMDIVCGVSHMYGIELTENFRRPFFAKSVSEFWQRWHITLGAWMRDYLFYPLALSKPFGKMSKGLRKLGSVYAAKVIPTCLASFIVFTLIGVWHGASWKYVAYGLYSATFVSTATLLEPFYAKCRKFFKVNTESKWFGYFQVLRTILLVTIGRYFSRAGSFMAAAGMYLATVKGFTSWSDFTGVLSSVSMSWINFGFMILMIGLLFFVDYKQEKGVDILGYIAGKKIVVRWIFYFALLFGIIIFGIYGYGYETANFIYQGF